EEADAYADRIVLIRQGSIVADGSAAQVKSMAAGRTVRATLPGADLAVLAALPGVTSVEARGDRVLLQARDSDSVLRYLLAGTPPHALEFPPHTLEEAFTALPTPRDPPAPRSTR